MSRHFGGQKGRPSYDHDALVEMDKTMTRRQIVQTAGISPGSDPPLPKAQGQRARRLGLRSAPKCNKPLPSGAAGERLCRFEQAG